MTTAIKNFLVVALAGLLTMSSVDFATGLNYSGNASTPNPYISDTVEKQTHDVLQFDSPLQYEADDGSTASMNARVNPDSHNPISFAASGVDYGQGQFPADDGDNTASSLAASEWISSQNVSVTDTKTTDTVNGVNIATTVYSFLLVC